MKQINVTDRLPEDNQYVLAHLTIDNWDDDDDPDGNRYWVVVKFRKGISKEERSALPESSEKARIYSSADEHGNNLVPYNWNEFGPGQYFGQEVDVWCELPKSS